MPEDLRNYNSSAPRRKGTIFGLPYTKEEAAVVIYPVPWEATVSYHRGTAFGPRAILDASVQLGLDLPHRDSPWKRGIWMSPMDGKIKSKSDILRAQIEPYLESLQAGRSYNSVELLEKVNKSTDSLRERIKQDTLALIQEGKLVGVLGGDHSCPLGFVEALAETHQDFGVLQIDAHMDLRQSYEGFKHSHVSIMRNVLELKEVSQLVQVGIRDFCEDELLFVSENEHRIAVFYDQVLKHHKFEGTQWKSVCEQIISKLPSKVYVSFDIGGLNPLLCPGTGSPVPGGLDYSEAIYLLQQVKTSGRQIIGFDLCEVAPQPYDQQWNANVGARVLYQLCGLVG